VLLAHCFTCSRHTTLLRQIGRDLSAAGIWVLRFDFSGNGQSGGEFARSTHSKQISEMAVAADVLFREGVRWLGLAGHSMGAVVAVLSASRLERVQRVCCMAGRLSGMDAARYLTLDQRIELSQTGRTTFVSRGRELMMTREFFSDAERFDLKNEIAGLEPSLLIVHGDADEIVPVAEAYEARSRKPEGSELFIAADADHMFSNPTHQESVSRKVVKWFTH